MLTLIVRSVENTCVMTPKYRARGKPAVVRSRDIPVIIIITTKFCRLLLRETIMLHCKKKLARLLFDFGVVNTSDDDCE